MLSSSRRTQVLVAVALSGSLLAACGGGSEESASAADGDEITLDVSLFGAMGFEESGLLDQYEQEHPGITIAYESTQEEADYWTALQTRMRSGDVPDVVGLEVGRIADVTANQADRFVDWSKTDHAEQVEQYVDWKRDAATTEDGRVIGMGTDIGPMALCYRSDLLEQAGLPTDRAELASRMQDWDDYLALGEEYQAAAPEGTAWTDAASGLYNAMVSTEEVIYYDESGEPVWDSNPAVREAFQTAAAAGEDGLTAKLQQFSPEWNQAFAGGKFATLACPSWMLGYIRGQAGDAGAGTWDVVTLPGEMGGNWGGSYLAVPEDSEHKEAAVDLVAWLTSPEQQQTIFSEVGNFPSNAEGITAVAGVEDDYFMGAPVGEIFGTAAEAAPVQVIGVNDGVYRTQLSNALKSVEVNGVSADDAWKAAGASIENQVG